MHSKQVIYSELLNARARYKTCPILRNVEKISGPSDPSRSSPCSAPAMFTTNKRLLQTNIRALLLRSVESWFGIRNIMGHVFIADRRTLVSIWSHDRNWWLTIQIAEGSIFCDRLWSQTIAEVCFNMIADDRRTFCDQRSVIAWYKFFRLLFLQHQVFFFLAATFFQFTSSYKHCSKFYLYFKKTI